jgi:DNA-binding transcriptional MerR regulator
MLRISEFAHLAQVSVRLLHHYDHIGLLKPAYVERETGYRYYALDQLARLNRILALKEMGLSLDEVGYLLNDALTADEMRTLLRLKQAELRARIAKDQARLAQAEARIKAIEQESDLPLLDVVPKSVPSMNVVLLRAELMPHDSIPALFHMMRQVLEEQGLRGTIKSAVGIYPWSFAVHNHAPTPFPYEAAFVMDCPPMLSLADGREAIPTRLPAYKWVASALHQGPDHQLVAAHRAVLRWMEINHYQMAGPIREIYWRRGSSDTILTEIQIPMQMPACEVVLGSEI